MSNESRDGGPAFPAVTTDFRSRWDGDSGGYPYTYSEGGMTLRDWFAGQAMASGWREFLTDGAAWDDYDDFAASCYAMADAMLAARVSGREG